MSNINIDHLIVCVKSSSEIIIILVNFSVKGYINNISMITCPHPYIYSKSKLTFGFLVSNINIDHLIVCVKSSPKIIVNFSVNGYINNNSMITCPHPCCVHVYTAGVKIT